MTIHTWNDYTKPWQIFGPLVSVDDTLARRARIGLEHYATRERGALDQIANWADGFVSRPHAGLGRKGDVCPFVRSSVAKRLFLMTSVVEDRCDQALVRQAMEHIREVFADMAPSSRPPTEITAEHHYKTITVLFPAVREQDAPEVIDGLHRQLKPGYVKDGFMIGEFHPQCPSPGLHNKDFRPLQAPVPMLVIRHITKWDAPFMTGSDAYIAAYLTHFGDEGRRRMAMLTEEACPLVPSERKEAIRRVIA
jgi:hypothetical protein